MTWIPTAKLIPYDLKRVWNPDGTNGVQSLAAGPVTGTAAIQAINSGAGPYGPSFWQESSVIGVVAEAAKYKGDWTWEAFVYFNNANQALLFSAGGWSAQATEDKNVTCLVYFNGTRLACLWETGVNVTVTPSATSNTNLSTATWYHLAIVKDSVAKTLAYYVNGVANGTATFSANPTGGDTASTGECRTGIGPYVGSTGHLNESVRIAAMTFSTVKRDATWMAASAAHKTTDATLPTDADTWINFGPILLSDLETAVNPADTAYAVPYDDGYADGFADGVDSIPPEDTTDPAVTIVSSPTAPNEPLVVSFSDEVAISLFELTCKENDGARLVIYDQIDGFCHPFASRSTISGAGTPGDPYLFTIYKVGGWATGVSINVRVRVVDNGGNVAVS